MIKIEGDGNVKEINIMEIGGFKVGHAQDYDAMTGCTVVLCDDDGAKCERFI